MAQTYKIIPPLIPSGYQYFFTTDQGTKYEVRFGQKRNNPLCYSIVFGVLNEEYDGEEYTETNKGEVFKVMATILKIVKQFLNHHPHAQAIEFTGESKAGEDENLPTVRTRLYLRYVNRYFGKNWAAKQSKNKIILYRKNTDSL